VSAAQKRFAQSKTENRICGGKVPRSVFFSQLSFFALGRAGFEYYFCRMKSIVILLFCTFLGHSAQACSCSRFSSFFQNARSAQAVVVVRVLSHVPRAHGPGHPDGNNPYYGSMQVEVLECLKGQLNRSSLVTVSGGDGASCAPPVGAFEEDKQYVIALSEEMDVLGNNGWWLCGECATPSLAYNPARRRADGFVREGLWASEHRWQGFFPRKRVSLRRLRRMVQ
jgi:hypothetical protein